jgi:squalene-associated FAD-dependent desaturase
MRFLGTIGTRGLVRVQRLPRMRFHHPGRGFRTLRLPPLPAPLHLVAGLFFSSLVGMRDRLRLLRGGKALRNGEGDDLEHLRNMTVEEWLAQTEQSDETRRSFWEPLAIAIMNERCATASAEVFVRALRKAFLSGRRSAAFAIPTVGLSDLFAYPAIADVLAHGGNVRLDCGVAEVLMEGGKVSGVRLEDGTSIAAENVILALPPHRIPSLLPREALENPFFASIPELAVSPIISLHLWFKEDVMGGEDVVGVIGRTIQWVFNRRKLAPPDANSPNLAGGYLCAVISAAAQELDKSNEDLLSIAMSDLRSIFGQEMPDAEDAVVVREKRATISCTPASEPLRPTQETPIPGLFLAGDWTATGYPATIEGAIISGEKCAGLIPAV